MAVYEMEKVNERIEEEARAEVERETAAAAAAEIVAAEAKAAAAAEMAANLGRANHGVKHCTYKDFLGCKPINFNGTEGAVGLTRWFEKLESVFRICSCRDEDKVKFATCTLLDGALTWWNTFAQTVGIDQAYQLPWGELRTRMTDEYCPRNEVKRLESEFWELSVKEGDIAKYTTRFHALALLCPSMVTPEYKRVERYIWGLPQSVQGMVTSSRPNTIQEAVLMAHELMDQVSRRRALQVIVDPLWKVQKVWTSN